MNSELFDQYAKHPTIELRNKIVEENLYMVDILIRKYLGKGVDYDDLYQVGALALVSAVERFDPSKGYEFKSFATPTILGEIKKLAEDRDLIFDEELMKFAMGNSIVIEDNNGNYKLSKKRSEEKIDNVAALMDAWVAYRRSQEAYEQ